MNYLTNLNQSLGPVLYLIIKLVADMMDRKDKYFIPQQGLIGQVSSYLIRKHHFIRVTLKLRHHTMK